LTIAFLKYSLDFSLKEIAVDIAHIRFRRIKMNRNVQSCSAKSPNSIRWSGLAWLPLVLLVLLMGFFRAIDSRTQYESEILLTSFNFIFSTIASMMITVLAARSYLLNGSPGLLMLGCGAIIWGPGDWRGQ